jgi:hypothetical protein
VKLLPALRLSLRERTPQQRTKRAERPGIPGSPFAAA